MLNLIIGIFVLCSSFGITLSKITSDYGVKKNRQHIKPLTIDKEIVL
ncbi:MAG: hypothetical protein RLZZ479_441 [Bacteroidota bacterium]|jgi:hypothetical protein